MDCYLMTHNATAQKQDGGGIPISSWLIGLRSYDKNGKKVIYDHTEFRFSERYGGISFSATMRDGCNCCRFKLIDYEKHPNRWERDVVPLSDDYEDIIFKEACWMAGIEMGLVMGAIHNCYIAYQAQTNGCFYGPKAIPYDTPGCALSFITKLPIWIPHRVKVWCSEAVCMLIRIVYKFSGTRCDKQTPASLRREWRYRK